MPIHKSVKSLEDLCVECVVDNLDDSAVDCCWSRQVVVEDAGLSDQKIEQHLITAFDLIRNLKICLMHIFRDLAIFLKFALHMTASPTLAIIFHEANRKQPKIQTKNLKLIVTRHLQSMNFSFVPEAFGFKESESQIELLCLAALKQLVSNKIN